MAADDANTSTYDMQARPYRPDIGRFATPDRYESASRDIGLQPDPLTNDRYAFAGGTPTTATPRQEEVLLSALGARRGLHKPQR